VMSRIQAVAVSAIHSRPGGLVTELLIYPVGQRGQISGGIIGARVWLLASAGVVYGS
jgi:hypothetical protein